MPCTTLLAGKKATYDGSTFAARNEDSGAGQFTPKKLVVVHPGEQPRSYCSVLSHVRIGLPDHPMRYMAMPNAVDGEGIWAAAGVNEANVAMTATETITSNARVLGADPLVNYVPAKGEDPEIPGGIGEEDIVTITLPYIHSAREGVLRLGELLKTYGTYEMNGIAFQDVNEIWWMETIGGHHWIAKRVPDDAYVVISNQFGIDFFDLADAFGEKKEHLCSEDLWEFIEKAHLDLAPHCREAAAGETGGDQRDLFDARAAFGSHSDSDHVYNTPRTWYMQRYLNPHAESWDSPEGRLTPASDDIPWSRVPERKITVEDVKYILSSHYQGTPYDPYGRDETLRGRYRPIAINRNNFLSLVQLRPYRRGEVMAIEWITFGSNAFNAFVPVYPNVGQVPVYYSDTSQDVSTESFYWVNRLIGALADACYAKNMVYIERYRLKLEAKGHHWITLTDEEAADLPEEEVLAYLEKKNEEFSTTVRRDTQELLAAVLNETSNGMKNAFSKSDA